VSQQQPGRRPDEQADTAADAGAPGAVTVVDLPVGRRVMVVSDLLLTGEETTSSRALTAELASALDAWEGPGVLVVAGNLFDLTGTTDVGEAARAAMEAHPRLATSCGRFLAGEERRILRQEGTHEPGLADDPGAQAALVRLGVERVGPVDLRLHTSAGVRTVRVEPGHHAYAAGCTAPETDLDPAVDAKPGAVDGAKAAPSWRVLADQSTSDAPWLAGLHRLSDPSALSRFVTSRTLYRRLGRYAWWMLVPFVVAVLLRVAVTPWVLHHAGTGVAGRALSHAHRADLADQLVVAALVAVAVMGVIAVLLGLLSRRVWSILGGGALVEVRTESAANDAARDEARRLVGAGYAGLVTAATFQPELTNLGVGFYANVGATAEVVEEERGRLGLPPVFVHRQLASWVELETGADLHVRLLVSRSDLSSPSLLERAVAPRRTMQSLHPTIVASYPKGDSWPPAPDLRHEHRRARRVRRLSAAAILVAGVVDLLDAVTPPLRYRLHLLLEVLPLRATEAAGALVALAGLALLALGRGVLRGQRRAWRISVALLAGSVLLHLAAGGDVEEVLLAAAVLVLLAVNRRDFQAASDWASLRSAVLFLVGGVAGVVTLATVSIELFTDVGHHHHPHHAIAWPQALWAASERLVGIRTIVLPPHLDRFLSPVMLAVGLAIVAVALFLLSRPVVDRRLTSGRAAELRARDIVRRHGTSTLDYFALRSDKRWFFHRDSLVAYAIYGGICLISPDPIGPRNERAHTWAAFRRFVDSHGWVPAVMGAAEEWLPVYRDSGMHHIYIGDEAVVPVQRFSLAGGDKKGLRQAHNRVAKKGYTASFHDPARLDRAATDELVALMGLSRRGEHERGFSMMLGRIFDPRDVGLLLTVVRAPDGRPAAMCQFVPAPGINGYSLDLMRRDPADHPNGLLDFALCSTIEHLRARGFDGLSLNFAAMRSTLAGEKGDGPVQRAERWFLRRLSNFAQIETLWRFNAKYDPDWLSRYVVFDTAEHLVPVIMAIFRAESLWEIPVIGRLLAAGAEKRMVAARRETEEALAEPDSLRREDAVHERARSDDGTTGADTAPTTGELTGPTGR
jgi:lysylphosphatidylglycerol synthetase-like protein (DUF2156 family)